MKLILMTGLMATTPILLTALGGAINREAGIVNIGLDGIMLAGAFVAVFVDWKTHSAILGCLAAIGAGGAVGLIFALPITRLGANEIVAGLGLGLLMPGLFAYILPVAFGQASTLEPNNIRGVDAWHIPLLHKIPFVGDVVFSQDPITYLSWLAIPLTWFLLYRTVIGLRLRAAGHNPDAALAAGLSLPRLRRRAARACRGAAVQLQHDQRPRLHRARRVLLRQLTAADDRARRVRVRDRLRGRDPPADRRPAVAAAADAAVPGGDRRACRGRAAASRGDGEPGRGSGRVCCSSTGSTRSSTPRASTTTPRSS
jgi:hypothetical protein